MANKIGGAIAGVLLFLFAIIGSYMGRYIPSAMSGLMPEGVSRGIMWVGLITNWIIFSIITPFYMITKHGKGEDT